MSQTKGFCCSSPTSICYWFAASLVAWGLLSLCGIYWHPLQASAAATILFAAGAGCVANWLKNRTFHCAITGPLFLIAGFVFLLRDVLGLPFSAAWIWNSVLIGAGVAFLLERQCVRRPPSGS